VQAPPPGPPGPSPPSDTPDDVSEISVGQARSGQASISADDRGRPVGIQEGGSDVEIAPMSPQASVVDSIAGAATDQLDTLFYLRAIYDRYDGDESGTLSVEDVGEMVKHFVNRSTNFDDQEKLAKEIKQVDQDEDASITFTEFRRWYSDMLRTAHGKEAKQKVGWRKVVYCWSNLNLPFYVGQGIGWVLVWICYVVTAVIALTIGGVLGNNAMRAMVIAWSVASAQTFIVEEPGMIALKVAAPVILGIIKAAAVGGSVAYAAGAGRRGSAPVEPEAGEQGTRQAATADGEREGTVQPGPQADERTGGAAAQAS